MARYLRRPGSGGLGRGSGVSRRRRNPPLSPSANWRRAGHPRVLAEGSPSDSYYRDAEVGKALPGLVPLMGSE